VLRGQETVLDLGLVSLNAAVVVLADEILRLPTAVTAATAVALLWGPDAELPAGFLAHVGIAARLPLPTLLATQESLAVAVPERLRLPASWRDPAQAARGARAAARARYRELQAAFVGSAHERLVEPDSALVRHTYATEARHWPWADVTARLLDRVVDVNRAALRLLAGVARGTSPANLRPARELLVARFIDLPDCALDAAAVALAPVVVPDFLAFTRALDARDASTPDDESIVRYRSLFAEILDFGTCLEAPA
jgi:hypothetical protein